MKIFSFIQQSLLLAIMAASAVIAQNDDSDPKSQNQPELHDIQEAMKDSKPAIEGKTLWLRLLPELSLKAGEDAPYLRPYIRYMQSYEGDLSFDGIGDVVRDLKPITHSRIQFGRPDGRVLAVFRVKNVDNRPSKWIFSTDRNYLQYVRLFEVSGDQLSETYSDGSLEEKRLNWNRYRSFASEVYLLPGEEKVVGVLFQAQSSTYAEMSVMTEENLAELNAKRSVLMASIVGGIFALVFFNAVMLIMTGRKIFIYVTISEVLFLYQAVYMAGYLTMYVFYDNPALGRLTSELSKCLFVFFTIEFTRQFLQTKIAFPNVDKVLLPLKWLSIVICGALLLSPFIGEGVQLFSAYAAWVIAGLAAIVLPFAAIEATKRDGVAYVPLIIAFSLFALFIAYSALAALMIVPSLPDHWRWYGPVGFVEAVFVTLAVGLDLKKIQEKAVETQRKLTESLRSELISSRRAKELAEDKAHAYASLNDQSSLIHAAGHDSKQVIVALNTATQYLEKAKAAEIPPAIINMLKSSASHLSGVISTTISSASNIGHSTHMLALGNKSLDQTFSSVDMIFKPMANKKGLQLKIMGHAEKEFVSDFALLYRVIANLVSNSIKFTDKGTIAVMVRYGNDCIRVQVRDPGCGMSASGVKMLMEDGDGRYRGDEDVEGSGTGFRSSQLIVKRLGGSIELRSEKSKGTTVEIRLPKTDVFDVEAQHFMVPVGQLHSFTAHMANVSPSITVSETYSKGATGYLIDLDMVYGLDREALLENIRQLGLDLPLYGLTNDVSIAMREWGEKHIDGILYKPISTSLLAGAAVL